MREMSGMFLVSMLMGHNLCPSFLSLQILFFTIRVQYYAIKYSIQIFRTQKKPQQHGIILAATKPGVAYYNNTAVWQ